MAIKVTYRWTSRLSMRIVKNGDVHVSAPIGLTKKKVLEFINAHRDWIIEARKRTEAKVQARRDFYNQLPINTRSQTKEAKARLMEIVKPMIEAHAKEMGVKPEAVTAKKMISRWGQCDVKNRTLCFSVYLLLLPDWCQEHVVVHELCHLLEPSHNARFYALMTQYYPRWREARKHTKAICGGTQNR